jgi:hypothetical protein
VLEVLLQETVPVSEGTPSAPAAVLTVFKVRLRLQIAEQPVLEVLLQEVVPAATSQLMVLLLP